MTYNEGCRFGCDRCDELYAQEEAEWEACINAVKAATTPEELEIERRRMEALMATYEGQR